MFNILLSLFLLLTPGKTLFDFQTKDINGKALNFSQFKGKKILIVNTASQCGYTPQYADLEKLSVQYKDKLVVIGFPANNFGSQEPGSNAEISSFCAKNYGVTFVMAGKVSVKGEDMDALFRWLTNEPNPDFTGDIKWNFEKFLIDENGKLLHRYRSSVKPLDAAITGAL